jgi:hypothetical protein
VVFGLSCKMWGALLEMGKFEVRLSLVEEMGLLLSVPKMRLQGMGRMHRQEKTLLMMVTMEDVRLGCA